MPPSRAGLRRSGLSLAVEPAAEQVALHRVVRRGGVVEPPPLRVDALDLQHVVVALGDQAGPLAVARHHVDVFPPIPLAHPGEALPVLQPHQVVHQVHPGAVLLDQHGAHLAGLRVAQHHLVAVLQPVEPLEDHLAGRGGPFHPGDVMVPRVPLDLHPASGTAGGAHHADPRRRVGLAHFGVLHRDHPGVERIGVVDHAEVPNRVGIELPVGHARAVGAPPPPVGVVVHQLFFVHPVEGAVDERPGAVVGQRDDRTGGEVLGVEVVLAHVAHASAVGGELGEHQGGGLGVLAAELPEATGGPVQHPVVAPGVEPPDRLGVGEHQQLAAVGRPGVVLDVERSLGSLGHQLTRRNQDLPAPLLHVVADDVLARPIGRGLDRGVGRAVVQPARGAERLREELGRAVDPLDREA